MERIVIRGGGIFDFGTGSLKISVEVPLEEIGRAAFPLSGAGDFAAGDSGVVRGNISSQEMSLGKPGSRMGPISLIIGKGPINGGGPDGGAT